MDPRTLSAGLIDLGVPRRAVAEPAAALRELEDRADRNPSDRRAAQGIRWLADRLAAEAQSPPVIAGVRREDLVRWDAESVTWVGQGPGGRPTMVRALRPGAARDPVLRRQLLRDGRALAPLLPVEVDEEAGALRLELAGLPLSPRRGDALARPLCTGLADLRRWAARGIGVPPLAEEELRGTERAAGIACLTPVEGSVVAGIASLSAGLVDPSDPSELAATVRALGSHPPTDLDDASRRIRSALAEILVGRRHTLAGSWRDTWHRNREARLRDAVDRLVARSPAPEGRGAVGVDLDGKITVLEAWPGSVQWAGEVVYDRESGVRPAVARRLLRARAASPPNPALNARVGGDPALTDAICRWVAASLKLRTIQLLLDRDPALATRGRS